MSFALLFVAGSLAFACQAVDGPRILGKDLAAANPAFAALDPSLEIGITPMASVRRVVHRADLARIARVNGVVISDPFHDVCFERAVEPLTAEKLLPALRSALAMDGVRIEILDFIRTGVPRGELEFARSGLSPDGLWRGRVAYADHRTAPVWVRVRVETEQVWIESSQPIEPGKIIERMQLTERKAWRFPFGVKPVDSLQLVIGQTPLRRIPPGEPIFASMLTTPRAVERGDKVQVEVASGGAKLSFDATAESSGHSGDSILIRNPENGRLFQARILGPGKVQVKL